MLVHIGDLLAKLNRVRKNARGWAAQCPAHKDENPSLSIAEAKDGRILLKCFAGCNTTAILAALGMNECDLFPDGTTGHGSKGRKGKGLTLAAYAEAKRLPAEFLDGIGIKAVTYSRRPALSIPYLATDGTVAARRFRVALTGEKKFLWERGASPIPYGLWGMAEARERGYVALVEGESDAQTLWYHGEPALGIPGAATWKDEWTSYFEEIAKVYAVIEPDLGGRELQRKLVQSPLRDRLWFVTLPGVKDISELHCLSPEAFKGRWKEALANAVPATQVIGLVLDELVTYLRRFVVLSEAQARVIALWVGHTHALNAADATPYLSVTSPEKQSGKTRLLEELETVVASPWLTGRVTPAVLTRKIDAAHPTLLLDESDAAFSGEREYAEALRGVLNTGHRRGGKASCCVGQGASISFRDFSTFCPKAIAGIGKLPDTVADRAIPIRLKRKAPGEHVERFHLRDVQSGSSRVRSELQAWAASVTDELRTARPHLPDQLSDRQQDGAEPLLAIADIAGSQWPDLARSALVELCTGEHTMDQSNGARLLADIRDIFEEGKVDRIPSGELVDALAKIETSPWPEWNNGKPITPPRLAKLLKPFGIIPDSIRVGDQTPKGYKFGQFKDAFDRYIRMTDQGFPHPEDATPQQGITHAGSSHFSSRHVAADVAAPESDKPNGMSDVANVAVSSRDTSAGGGSSGRVEAEKEWRF